MRMRDDKRGEKVRLARLRFSDYDRRRSREFLYRQQHNIGEMTVIIVTLPPRHVVAFEGVAHIVGARW